MNEPTGVKKAIDAAWGKLPEILIASVVAVCVFSFSLWLDCRDVKRDISAIYNEQEPDRLCQRIGSCAGSTGGAGVSLYEVRAAIGSIRDKLEERGIRISNLEQQVYELRTNPQARPGSFTASMGSALEDRIKALEKKP